MALFGFHRRGREHDRKRERNEREWADNRTRDWGERRYAANERLARDRNAGDQYGPARTSSPNRFERPEEFGQNRGDWRNDWRASEHDRGHDEGRRSWNDRWQESYGPHASPRGQPGYRGSANEGYESSGEFYRGRDQGTHGAYWSPQRTDFSDFGRGSDFSGGEFDRVSYYGRGGEMSTHDAGQHRGRGPKGYRRSDERIREDVCECLMEDERIDATNIEVNVKECEVTLTGTVNSREEKRRAENLIDELPGVRDIHNSLRVVNEGGLIEGATQPRH